MQCRFCLFQNAEDEVRCQRCHKRLNGDITLDGVSMDGATALAPRRSSSLPEIPSDGIPAAAPRKSRAAAASVSDRQSSLFNGESNVIPFDAYQRPSAVADEPGPAAKHLSTAKHTIRKPAGNRRASETAMDHDIQGSLNLLPAAQTPRILKTTVEASIYCDAGVATPVHRFIATMLDIAMILLGGGLFLAFFQIFGGGVRIDKFDTTMFALALLLIAMFYGLTFALSGRETAGQSWTNLRLINFDGFPPDGSSRALRFLGTWLSLGACGVGLLWALLDEEYLTWHDHMSKTFLTIREADSSFFRERPR